MRLAAVMFALTSVLCVHAASTALIIVGLTASESDAAFWQRLAGQARTGLIARSFAPENIILLASADNLSVSRDNVLAAFAKVKASAKADDSLTVLLLGHSAPGRDGTPSFQLRGPRLTAADLHDALVDYPGAIYVLLGSEQSSGYLPLLKTLPRCTAVAASDGPMVPRFPEYWVDALNANPKASFAELAATAADRVASYYTDQHLARGENASLLSAQTIQEAPFTGIAVAPAAPAPTSKAPSAAAALTSIEFAPPTPATGDAPFTVKPADDESRTLLTTAQMLSMTAGDYPAIVLHQELDITFNADRTSTVTTRLRVYLRRPEAIDAWADYDFIHMPPAQVTVIESARVIQPDGSLVVVNPTRLNSAARPPDSEIPIPFHVHLPQVTAGAIVEIAWREEHGASSDLPEAYAEFALARSAPVEDTLLILRTPKNDPKFTIFHQFRQLPSAPDPVESATEHSQVLTWHLSALPAWEPLPNDPPARDLVPMFAVSSFSSWDAFTSWIRRLTAGTFDAGPATRAAAAEIARTNAKPADRLRAAYDQVSSLRYVAIELGINGFRPRPPDTVLNNRYGDCKDKATLLAAMLRELGIPAEIALLNRGSSTDISFPGWQFNHALVHVPASDGIPEQWLDATDGTTPPGFVGPGDLGRNALVFSGTRANFLTITDSKRATTINDTWTLTQQPDGSWSGKLVRKLTGLADEAWREELRPLTPVQRADWLQTHFAGLSGDVEFSKPTVSDLSNIDDPMSVEVEVSSPASAQPYGPDHPVPVALTIPPGLRLAEELAAPERDRAFLVNDGQPVRYEQQVSLTFTHPVELSAVTTKSSDSHSTNSITYTRPDPRTLVRSTTLDIAAPVVPAADYTAFRRAILDWRRALTVSFPNP